MRLSCECYEWDGDGITYIVPDDFTKLNTRKRKRCRSCKKLIDVGSTCVQFKRIRMPYSEVEAKIYGDDYAEVKMASHYHCESCGEIFLNLEALGYCIDPDDNMEDALKEYHNLTGFKG